MLIKKRWAWLTSVVLLGFLASADGHEKDCSLTVTESFVVDPGKVDILHDPLSKSTNKYIKLEESRDFPDLVTVELVDSEDKVGQVEGIQMVPLEEKKPVAPQAAFPYAIDSSPSMTHVASMLSYCVYHEVISMKECEEFWAQTCDGDALHQYTLDGMNVMTVCKQADRVYVAFAGTQSRSDIAVDLSALSRSMSFSRKTISGHGGFVERAKVYSAWVKKRLAGIEGIAGKELVLTGHSLGAALATLLAHDVYEGLGLDTWGGASNSLNQVKVIGFGSPSALLDPASYFVGHLNHLRFYNPYDPVATTASWFSGYKHVGVELVIPDGPARHIARAGPLLNQHFTLRLLRQLPLSYWMSLPPLLRSRLDALAVDAHSMYAYAILADKAFEDEQKQRRQAHPSLASLVNAEKAVSKRIGTPVTCKLVDGKVACSSQGKIVAKFRYAMDALAVDQKNACMSSIMNANSVPGVTVNAGMTMGNGMSPSTTASEALILDIFGEEKWHEHIPARTFASLYLDGHSPLPATCSRKPTFLEPGKTLAVERDLLRRYIHAPQLFTLTKGQATPETEFVEFVHLDPGFFSDATQGEWMDCRLPENSTFCPQPCMGNQACAVMKWCGSDADGVNHWVSVSRDPGLKWVHAGNDSWKYTVGEKRTSWFSMLRTQSQATFMVVKDDPEGHLQFSN